jgi:hypothetical protein
MNDFRDPSILHSAECRKCGFTYSDGDVLDENGVCPLCQDDYTEDEEGDPSLREKAAIILSTARQRKGDLMDAIFSIVGAR